VRFRKAATTTSTTCLHYSAALFWAEPTTEAELIQQVNRVMLFAELSGSLATAAQAIPAEGVMCRAS